MTSNYHGSLNRSVMNSLQIIAAISCLKSDKNYERHKSKLLKY